MKRMLRVLSVVACLFGVAAVSEAGLIVNGSFETTPAFQNGTWGLFPSILGWSATGAFNIEVGRGTVYGVTGFDGLNVLELDSTGNAVVSQIVATPGGIYQLSFLGAKRNNVAESSTRFQVYWNGGLVGNYSPTLTAMSLYSATVTAAASNTLEFRGAGTQDSYGALIDDVRLTSVPDGGVTVILLGIGITGLGVLRRKAK